MPLWREGERCPAAAEPDDLGDTRRTGSNTGKGAAAFGGRVRGGGQVRDKAGGGAGLVQRIIVLLCAAWLASCAHGGGAGGAGGCCASVERYPAWLVEALEPAAPVIGRIVGSIVWRDGYIPAAGGARRIADALRPLDILVTGSKGRLSNHAIPGHFVHFAVHLGSEAQLRRAGLWNDPRVVPHHAALEAGRVFIEADHRGVHLSTAETVLSADHVAVLRPQLAPQRRRRATGDFLDHAGSRFDFLFDSAEDVRLYCAELVCHLLPELRMPKRNVYGRSTIIPDDVVLRAARGQGLLRLVLYVRARPGKWEQASPADLVEDIARAWR